MYYNILISYVSIFFFINVIVKFCGGKINHISKIKLNGLQNLIYKFNIV